MGSDTDWMSWGDRDPYFGVLSHDRFRRQNLTEAALEEFFQTGRRDVGEMLDDCRRYLGSVSLRRTLDFGCGVGRMLIPISELSEQSVGVDVSGAMRAEAARNCEKFNHRTRHNVWLFNSLNEAKEDGNFSLIYSHMVLQHIETRRGIDIIAKLLDSLEPGGCAALHVTYAHVKYASTLGVPPAPRVLTRRLRYSLSRISRRIRGRDPQMEMNHYNLSRVLFLAQTRGVRTGGFRLTGHDQSLGAVLYFRSEP